MKSLPDDDTELVIVLPGAVVVPELSELDLATERRAFRHGLRARPYFPLSTFDEAESELRAGWLLNGETARWRDVREIVRNGFEYEDSAI